MTPGIDYIHIPEDARGLLIVQAPVGAGRAAIERFAMVLREGVKRACPHLTPVVLVRDVKVTVVDVDGPAAPARSAEIQEWLEQAWAGAAV